MALGMVTTLRNSRLDAITTAVGASGKLRVYSGTQPATGGTATTLLIDWTLNATFAPAATAATLTLNAITNVNATATGNPATWHRLLTSAAAIVMDGTVGTSGSDLNLNTVSITSGGPCSISSYVITEANA